MENPMIWFPGLGIKIENLDRIAFNFFFIPVYWYGLCIALAFILGLLLATRNAKRFGVNPDIYADFLVIGIIASIIGARLYYVAFEWDSYKNNLISIINLRNGGLAIYGGIIGAVISTFFYCRYKKLEFFKVMDLAMPGISLGQAIGRWGNFFNKEAFGGYTNNVFAMRIRTDAAAYIPESLKDTVFKVNSSDTYSYIQVHPTFLYESIWNILLCIFLYNFCKRKSFDGQIFYLYFLLYGVGRFFIEYMRTDQLLIGSTNIPISMVISLSFSIISIVMIVLGKKRSIKNI